MKNHEERNLHTEDDAAIRSRILARARDINGSLLARLAVISDDLDAGRHLAAIGGLDGIEREITQLRNYPLLIR